MTCKNCEPWFNREPNAVVRTNATGTLCADCLTFLIRPKDINKNWDKYFHTICEAVASKSPCLSRHIGAILVRDHSIVSTGFNGPSRGIPHCGRDRLLSDIELSNSLLEIVNRITRSRIDTECPRKLLDYESGTHMELCPAQHAEVNAIIDAARKGASTIGTTLYMNCIIPCKNCFGALINAGIVEIVVDNVTVYDKHTQFLIDNSTIKIRKFEL